ncbi:hypothetical protein [uncultured Intestinimonas sp.]|uniref:hypothetical protein n=1 Tax=uncultured Intestinimonas sp. TaxID=1689265 RepID=UPI0025EEA2C4|nr:hypothetical protein [uncultured Intestinimonas sp.]
MKRLLRPIMLEFCRSHLILTALVALLTVLVLTASGLLGLGNAVKGVLPFQLQRVSSELSGTLPALIPLVLGLLAYLPAGRFARKRNFLPRPDAEEAILLLLVPAAAFWLLLALAYLIPHGSGLLVAAMLLNCPAYGLYSLLAQFLGWGSGGSLWTVYVGGLVTGLLPPLLYLMGSYLPIAALDQEEDADEEFIEKQ